MTSREGMRRAVEGWDGCMLVEDSKRRRVHSYVQVWQHGERRELLRLAEDTFFLHPAVLEPCLDLDEQTPTTTDVSPHI